VHRVGTRRQDCSSGSWRRTSAKGFVIRQDAYRRRAVQPIHGEMTYGVSQQLAELFRGNEEQHLGRLVPLCDIQKANTSRKE
jgi:hypothetical protein